MKDKKIIAIEGIDGSGKSLQFEMLKNRLEGMGNKCLALSFPIYDSFFGVEIGKMLSGKNEVSAEKLDPKSMALWYAMDRFNVFKNLNIKEYDYILLNRYILSNAVYQSIRAPKDQKNEFINWVFYLENVILELPMPDICLILDVDSMISKENVKAKGYRDYVGNEADVYEKSLSFMGMAREAYLNASIEMKNVHVVPCVNEGCMEKPEVIHERIWRFI